MTGSERARAMTQAAVGKAKEAVGRAVGDDRMTAEGRAEQSEGDALQVREKTKDVFRH
ncbi:CsbD family protein [Streptomyces sp. NBC_00638]|uniref:CsbD family protein n=1 Tax=unclassified Streptomyces TaxID=2593676 RepID=UPI002251B1E3|nr:CsbD family protein [Streptomyces sp. NBC_00638]MCX5001533.1 CsbD family protein [Streptomyces sp. NBC_00638]